MQPLDLDAHGAWLRRLARALTADGASAEDLVQDAWLSALRHPPEPGRSPRPWLARVLRNLALNARRRDERRERRERETARSEATAAADATAAELELNRRLADALMRLGEPTRTTIVRRFLHGQSSADIARAEGLPESTIRNRVKRGLDALRKDLDREYGERGNWAVLLGPLAQPPPATTLILGGLLMSKVKIAVACAALLLVLWFLFRPQPLSPDVLPASSPAVVSSDPLAPALPVEKPQPAGRVAAVEPTQTWILVEGTVTQSPFATDLRKDEESTLFSIHHWEVPLPLRDARVRLHLESAAAPALLLRTDEDGHFSGRVPDPGTRPVQVLAELEGDAEYPTLQDSRALQTADESSARFELVRHLRPDWDGTAVDEIGRPLASVEVRCVHEMDATCGEARTTGDDGQFLLPRHNRAHLEYRCAGRAVYSRTKLQGKPDDKATRVRVMLVPAGQLVVHLVDAQGKPVPYARVRCALFVAERSGGDASSDIAVGPRQFGPEWRHPPGMRSPDEPTTRADGLFVIDDCWIGYPLKLEIDSDYLEYSSLSLNDDKFVWSPGEGATEFVVSRPGTHLTAALGRILRVTGQVWASDGSKTGRCALLLSGYRPDDTNPFIQRLLTMMTDGSFNFPFDPIAGIQDWTLEASTANLNMHFAGGAKAEPRALVRLEPDSAKDGVLHVDLHLGAAGLIAGKVSGVEGQGRCIVTAIPSGARSFVPSHADSSEFSCSPDEKGSFVLRELRGESYDLVLTQASDAQFRSALLENIPVGTENVDLRLTRPLDVVLHVSATPAHGGEPIARMLVLFDWPTMPPRTSDTPGDSSDEWPEAIPISDFRQPLERGWNGGRQTIGGVHHSFSLKPWPSDQFDPPPQEAGWIRVGVIAWDALGRQCLPVTTGMQRWEPGEHEVRLAVQRSCDLRVRLSIPPASTGKLELVAPGGGSIRFSLNGARLRRSASVHGGQQLELSCVPAGQCTLRFTPAQAGPTKEMQVTVDDSGKLVVFE